MTKKRITQSGLAIIVLAVMATVAITVSAKRGKSPASDDEMPQQMKRLVRPLSDFTGSFYKQINDSTSNLIFSPLSIHAALNLVALGIKPNTALEKKLHAELKYPKKMNKKDLEGFHLAYKSTIELFKKISAKAREEDEKADEKGDGDGCTKLPKIEFFNSIIADSKEKFKKQYVNRTMEFFQASMETIDKHKPETIDRVCKRINEWAEEAGFEHDIVKPEEFKNDSFAAMLLSSVNFQASWSHNFTEHDGKAIFYNHGLKSKPIDGKILIARGIAVNLMEFCDADQISFKKHSNRVDKEDENLNELNMLAIQVELVGNLRLTILEPKSSGKGHELKEMVDKLLKVPSSLDTVLRYLNKESSRTMSSLKIPKFGFESDINLKELRMFKLFEKEELTEIVSNGPLEVTDARHKAVIDVDKYGIKAAAVTKINLGIKSASLIDSRVEVKNPFLFLITYNQMILFAGQLVKLNQT